MEAEDIGRLVDLAIRARHESYRGFAERNHPLNVKTVMAVIAGKRRPIPRSVALIEDGLGWAPGTFDWLWQNYERLDFEELNPLKPMKSWKPRPKPEPVESAKATETLGRGLSKARELTDQELITELASRLLKK